MQYVNIIYICISLSLSLYIYIYIYRYICTHICAAGGFRGPCSEPSTQDRIVWLNYESLDRQRLSRAPPGPGTLRCLRTVPQRHEGPLRANLRRSYIYCTHTLLNANALNHGKPNSPTHPPHGLCPSAGAAFSSGVFPGVAAATRLTQRLESPLRVWRSRRSRQMGRWSSNLGSQRVITISASTQPPLFQSSHQQLEF